MGNKNRLNIIQGIILCLLCSSHFLLAQGINCDSIQLEVNIQGKLGLCQDSISTLDAGLFTSYFWSTGDTSQMIDVAEAGTIWVTVIDTNGCEANDTVVVQDIPTPMPDIIGPPGVCIGGTTQLSVVDTFATYQWSTGESSSEITIDQPGAYLVTVTDGSQCRGAAGILIGEDEALNAEIFGITQICPGDSTVLLVGAFSEYLWSTGDTTRRLKVDQAGTYMVTVTNERSCSVSDTVIVESLASSDLSIIGSSTLCPGSTTTLRANDTYNAYFWSNGLTDSIITISLPGTYSLTVTNDFSCPAIDSFEVVEANEITPVISSSGLLCQDSSITLDPGPFTSYLWSNGDTSRMLDVSVAGVYTVSVTDANGCGGTSNISINSSPSLQPNIIGSSTICPGSSIRLNTDSLYDNYEWSSGTFQTFLEVNAPGTYSVTVSNDDSCPGFAEFNVRSSSELEINLPANVVFCEGQSTNLDAGLFDTYLWSTGDTTQQINISVAGEYSVTVSNSDGCDGMAASVLTQIPFPESKLEGDTLICPNGQTNLSLSEGFETYLWSTGAQTSSISVSQGGAYQVTVSNGSVCSRELMIQVQEIALEAAQAAERISVCESTASITANLPAEASGLWTSAGIAQILNAQSPMSEVLDLEDGDNLFSWTLSTSECPNYSSIDLIVNKAIAPLAIADQVSLQGNDPKSISLDLATNDDFTPDQEPILNLLSTPDLGQIEAFNGSTITYTVAPGTIGESSFRYQICDGLCIDLCSEAIVNIEVDFSDESIPVPNGITPNGDGQNESFIFALIEENGPSFYPDNLFLVFNRWGNIVYEHSNYDNSWSGTNQSGEELPEGTYYYILYLDISEKQVFRGDVTIIR